MASLSDLLKKAKGAFEKIPLIATEAKQDVKEYFAPSPDDVRVRDVVREVPSNTGEMLKDILQGTARSFDFVGRKIQQPVGKLFGIDAEAQRQATKDNPITSSVDQFLFGGSDKRVNDLASVGEQELGINKEKNPILAPLAGLGIIGLDVVPGGQGKSKGLKQFIKSLTDDVAETLAKTTDRNLIEQTVRESAPALKDTEVVKLVDELTPTKTADEVRSLVTGVPTKTEVVKTPKILNIEPDLIVEAHVARTPEEFTTIAKRMYPDMADGDLLKAYNDVKRWDESPVLKSLADYKLGVTGQDSMETATKDFMQAVKKDPTVARKIALSSQASLKESGATKLYRYGDKEGLSWTTKPDEFFSNGRPLQEMDITPEVLKRVAYAEGAETKAGYQAFPNTGESEVILSPATKSVSRETPQQYFHGTNNADAIVANGFDVGKAGENSGYGGVYGKGVYLTNDAERAGQYGTAMKTMIAPDTKFLEVKGEDAIDVLFGRATDYGDPEKITEYVLKQGYDGVRITGKNGAQEVVVMNPAKVRIEGTPIKTAVTDKTVEASKEQLVDSVPAVSKAKVEKALNGAEAETKKLSPRRLQDAKKYGISEDVMGRMLHAKSGGRLTHEEANNLAETINAPLKDLLTKSPRQFQLDRPKIEAYSQELQGYFEKVVKDLKAQSETFPKDKDLREAYQEASRTYMKARTTLEAVISEAGRVVEGSKVIGKYSRLPGMDGKIKTVRNQIVKYAETHPKSADLPTEFDMALETVDLNNTTQMLDFLTQWNRASFLQKLSEFQKASLLSALSTHGVNALGNAIQQVLDIPVRALAGTLDAGKSAITGSERTVYAGESLAQVRGAFRSAPSAIERAIKALGNEHYAQELRRTEIEAGTVVPAIRGRFGKVVRLPFRLLQMADLGFRTVKQGAEGDALALRIAKKEGLKGKELTARVDELKNNLPADMLDLIDERVERSLMLEETDGLLKSVEDMKNKYPALQFVIPFYRTLVNLSKEAYRMTPIGGVGRTVGRLTPGQTGRNIENAFHNKWTRDQNTKMEELSRQIIGTSIMAWVVTNMVNGDIEVTGPAPSNAGDREVFYGQGKLPHSIRWGDKWVEFQRVQPIGQLIQVGASISEAIEAYKNTGQLDSAQVEKEMLNSLSDIGSMVFTQSPFTGASDLFALLSGGEYNEGYFQAGNRYLGQLAGTFIPNILRRLTVAQDPIIYEKRDIPSQLKSRVPGLAQTLTPKRDTFGETIRSGGTFASRFASPIRTTEVVENQLYDEMAKIKYSPTVPSRSAFNEPLSVKEYDALRLFYGPRFRDELYSIVNDNAYKTLNDEQKRDVMSGVSRKVMDLARQTLFPVYMEKNQLRTQWEQDGYSPAVIEDALNAQFPYDKETLEVYAQNILDENIQTGEARKTIEDLLK